MGCFSLKDLLFHDDDITETVVKGITGDFPLRFYGSERVSAVMKSCAQYPHHLDSGIISKLSKKISLHFSREEENAGTEDANSPVCYAGSSEVTDDFKVETYPSYFSEINVLDYTCGILQDRLEKGRKTQFAEGDITLIPFPSSQVEFWKWVKKGEAMRKQWFAGE